MAAKLKETKRQSAGMKESDANANLIVFSLVYVCLHVPFE